MSAASRRPYKIQDHQEILDFITERKVYNILKGDVVWKQMAPIVCGGARTWQSLKQTCKIRITRQLNHPNYHQSYKITPKERMKILQSYGIQMDSNRMKELIDVSSDEELHGHCSEYTQDDKRYTVAEHQQIIDYIVTNEAFPDIKGDTLWKRMESEVCGKKRTWQSLKQTFKLRIFPRLVNEKERTKYYRNIDETTLNNFKQCNAIQSDSSWESKHVTREDMLRFWSDD